MINQEELSELLRISINEADSTLGAMMQNFTVALMQQPYDISPGNVLKLRRALTNNFNENQTIDPDLMRRLWDEYVQNAQFYLAIAKEERKIRT